MGEEYNRRVGEGRRGERGLGIGGERSGRGGKGGMSGYLHVL